MQTLAPRPSEASEKKNYERSEFIVTFAFEVHKQD